MPAHGQPTLASGISNTGRNVTSRRKTPQVLEELGSNLRRSLGNQRPAFWISPGVRCSSTFDRVAQGKFPFTRPYRSSFRDTSEASGQGSHHRDPATPVDAGILLRHFRGSEEGLTGTKDDPQPCVLQPALSGTTTQVQDVHSETIENRGPARRLASFARLEGRLSPCSYPSGPSEVSEVHVRPETFRVASLAIRNCSSTMAVHQDHTANLPGSTFEGYILLPLHRRLPYEEPRQITTGPAHSLHKESPLRTGMDCQPRQVEVGTISTAAVYRRSSPHRQGPSPSSLGQMGEDPDFCQQDPHGISFVPSVAEDPGSTNVSPRLDSQRTSTTAAGPDVPEPFPGTRQPSPGDTTTRQFEAISPMVAAPVERLRRNLLEAVHSNSPSLRGRISTRLGSTHGRPYSGGAVVIRRKQASHQLARAESHLQCH